jgi:maleylpyruvate isomerase
VARNADGLRRMAEGAARGEIVDQYVGGVEGRAAGIEAGAARRAGEQLADLEASAASLAAVWDAMPDDAWANRMRPLRGEGPASDGPGLRLFEVEVHLAELPRDYGPHEWPSAFVDVWLERVVRILRGRASTVGAPANWRLLPDE